MPLYFARARLLACVFVLASSWTADAFALPPGFRRSEVLSELDKATSVAFSPSDNRVFVGEKSGVIKVFDDLADTTPDVAVALSGVYTNVDHGLLGLAVDPQFPARPYLYALYSHALGANAARLTRLTLDPSTNLVEAEELLISGWCEESTTHAIGHLAFGPDGALYVSSGDGADPGGVDWGDGDRCADPVREGGALRSQDMLAGFATDALDYNGTILRIDPISGLALPDNPRVGGDSADDRVIAFGLRNPFRFTIHPTTGELYVADVGWNDVEEINLISSATDAKVENFGWPCYEGSSAQPGYRSADLALCKSLYQAGSDDKPFYEYRHNGAQASVTGVAVYSGSRYPSEYRGALFFADYAQGWIKVMRASPSGRPDPASVQLFETDAPVVQLTVGPGGDLFFLTYDLTDDHFHLFRVQYDSEGASALSVHIDADQPALAPGASVSLAATSAGASGEVSYTWDLDGDGVLDDAIGREIELVGGSVGPYAVTLLAVDEAGHSAIAHTSISVSDQVPSVAIVSPATSFSWAVGDPVSVRAEAVLPSTGEVLSSVATRVLINHCAKQDPNDCHGHEAASFPTGAGVLTAPDHEYPASLELVATATGLAGPEDWLDPGWLRRRMLHIDRPENASALGEAVIYLVLDTQEVSSRVAGRDLRVVGLDGVVWPHAVVSWQSAGEAHLRVRVPTLSAQRYGQAAWLYYANDNAPYAEDVTLLSSSAAEASATAVVSGEAANTPYSASTRRTLAPRTVTLSLDSAPAGLALALGSEVGTAPLSRTVIAGSRVSIAAPAPQMLGDDQYDFVRWSHGGDAAQPAFVAPQVDTSLLATLEATGAHWCTYRSMSLRGTYNAWGLTPMALSGPCTFAVVVDLPANAALKLDVRGDWGVNFGDNNNDGIAEVAGGNIRGPARAGTYMISFRDDTRRYAINAVGAQMPQTDVRRTVVLVYGQTKPGEDMFVRGGIDALYSNANRGTSCNEQLGAQNVGCSFDIRHRNTKNNYIAAWQTGDLHFDWGKVGTSDGRESGQGAGSFGTPASWTTNDPTYFATVERDGFGYTPLNREGPHYWMLDLDVDCAQSIAGWIELKTFITGTKAWEPDVRQTIFGGLTAPPYTSRNHFARCGYLNVFARGQNEPVRIEPL